MNWTFFQAHKLVNLSLPPPNLTRTPSYFYIGKNVIPIIYLLNINTWSKMLLCKNGKKNQNLVVKMKTFENERIYAILPQILKVSMSFYQIFWKIRYVLKFCCIFIKLIENRMYLYHIFLKNSIFLMVLYRIFLKSDPFKKLPNILKILVYWIFSLVLKNLVIQNASFVRSRVWWFPYRYHIIFHH